MGSSCSSLLKRGSGITEPEVSEYLNHGSDEPMPERPMIIKATERLGPPSLAHCAILSLSRNIHSLDSLQGVPQELVQQLFAALVSTRLLTHEQLPLLVSVIDARLPSYPAISDDWLLYMGLLFTNLTRLDISNCMQCTDEGSKCLTGLPFPPPPTPFSPHLCVRETERVRVCVCCIDASIKCLISCNPIACVCVCVCVCVCP